MTLSLEQLKNPPTRDDISSWLIEQLRELGFVTTAWQPGRIQQQILNTVASVAEPVAQTASTLVKLSFNSEAKGAIQDLYSESRFNNTRKGAEKAIGYFAFDNIGATPYDLIPGKVVIQDSRGIQFISDETITVAAGVVTNVRVTALLSGASGNIGNDSALSLVTPLAGVLVTNPSPDPTASIPPSWANIQQGSDPESSTSLRERNATKWGLLAIEKTDAAYVNLAIGVQGIAKAKVVSNNPRGPGTVDVLVATDVGLPSTAQMQELQSTFAEFTFLTEESWPASLSPHVAVIYPDISVLNLEGNVYYDSSREAEQVEADVTKRLDALLALTPIGGIDYAASVTGILTLADITDAIKDTPGVNSCTLVTPEGDQSISANGLLIRPASGWFSATRLQAVEGSGS